MMEDKLKEVLELLKNDKRAGGMEYSIYSGVEYVKRSEVIGLEAEYWESQKEIAELKKQREWIPVSEGLPEKERNEPDHVLCWIRHQGETLIRPYNTLHKCFDDVDYDDHFCNVEDVSHYIVIESPKPPKEQG